MGFFVGVDFGTLSVRGVVVDTSKRAVVASTVKSYEELVIELDDGGCVFKDADEWVRAGKLVIEELASSLGGTNIDGVGITFTSCTVVPLRQDGRLVSTREDDPHKRPHVFAKMWKHHSPSVQRCADDLTNAARGETWLDEHYGGNIGLEWMYPKALEVFDGDKRAFQDTYAFVEGGDFVVWALLGRQLPLEQHLVRSSQQAAYKGCFIQGRSLISKQSLKRIRPIMSDQDVIKLDLTRYNIKPPSACAGMISIHSKQIPLTVASIDAHACALGLGASKIGRLVLVVGTSACFMISAERPQTPLQGAAGFVPDGIVQGLYAYEFGQAAVGDTFAWFSRFAGRAVNELEREAKQVLKGSSKELDCWAVSHLNGCRTPLMRGDMKGEIHGLTLSTSPAQVFLALMEAICFGIKVVLRMLTKSHVPVEDIVLAGGLASKSELFPEILSTVLDRDVIVFDDGGEATSRGAAAYAQLMLDKKSDTSLFEPTRSRVVKPSKEVKAIVGNDLRFARYSDAALVRSFI